LNTATAAPDILLTGTTATFIGDDVGLSPIPAATIPPRKDGIFSKIAIFALSYLLAAVSKKKSEAMKHVYPGMDFGNFVKVTRTLLVGTADDIKNLIVGLLLSLMPPPVRESVRKICLERPRWISEKSSEFMSFGLLGWLVGPVERVPVTITHTDGTSEEWLSGVKIKECRYLVDSGCKAACLHLCKGPTQSFFNDELGLKLHMKPNFTDLSCEMFFGVDPPSAEDDPAYGEPCFSTCSMRGQNKPLVVEMKLKHRQRSMTAAAASNSNDRTLQLLTQEWASDNEELDSSRNEALDIAIRDIDATNAGPKGFTKCS
jgi:hypothetical protein